MELKNTLGLFTALQILLSINMAIAQDEQVVPLSLEDAVAQTINNNQQIKNQANKRLITKQIDNFYYHI